MDKDLVKRTFLRSLEETLERLINQYDISPNLNETLLEEKEQNSLYRNPHLFHEIIYNPSLSDDFFNLVDEVSDEEGNYKGQRISQELFDRFDLYGAFPSSIFIEDTGTNRKSIHLVPYAISEKDFHPVCLYVPFATAEKAFFALKEMFEEKKDVLKEKMRYFGDVEANFYETAILGHYTLSTRENDPQGFNLELLNSKIDKILMPKLQIGIEGSFRDLVLTVKDIINILGGA